MGLITGGETIKEMQNSTGCRINVSSQFNQNDPEREITLAGSRDAVARARKAIDNKVESKTQRGGRSTRLSKAHVCKEALDEREIEYTEEADSFMVHRFVDRPEEKSLCDRTDAIRGRLHL